MVFNQGLRSVFFVEVVFTSQKLEPFQHFLNKKRTSLVSFAVIMTSQLSIKKKCIIKKKTSSSLIQHISKKKKINKKTQCFKLHLNIYKMDHFLYNKKTASVFVLFVINKSYSTQKINHSRKKQKNTNQ